MEQTGSTQYREPNKGLQGFPLPQLPSKYQPLTTYSIEPGGWTAQ